MAGRVEKIINNKFYFVLDEVGASDVESELDSENDPKESRNLGLKENLSNEICPGNSNSSNNECEGSEIKNASPHTQNAMYSEVVDQNAVYDQNNLSADLKENTCDDNENYSSSPNSPHTIDLSPDETSVIDMEIDSEENDEQSHEKDEPLVRVTFRDQSAEKLLKAPLVKFFSQKVEKCSMVTSKDNILELKVFCKNLVKPLKNDVVGFDLDTTPTHGNYSEIPHYGKNHEFVLSEKSSDKNNVVKNLSVSRSSCFNCLGSHNLKDCPEVKDFRVINKNRLKFQNKNRATKTSSRYHLDEAQKFSGIVPGTISKKLRNALGLHRDQQPSFIYRMRLLGYPPAWLEEAKVSHSGVALYDSTGVPVLEDDEEEGEILPEGSKDRFDISKIIEFPGFNVPLPNNFKDETKIYGCPDISEEQSKQNLIKLLEPKTVQAYVKKTLTISKADDRLQDDSKCAPSPTIEEMEEKKRQLLMELDDEESGSLSKLSFDNSSSSVRVESEILQNSINSEPGSVKNLEFGTPILKSVSPYSKLPSRELFSVDVGDIINFENLPNSTGKYETIRHVISKIRIAASNKQNK